MKLAPGCQCCQQSAVNRSGSMVELQVGMSRLINGQLVADPRPGLMRIEQEEGGAGVFWTPESGRGDAEYHCSANKTDFRPV